MKFNGIEIHPEIIQQTREWFAENSRQCIADAISGTTHVNDLERYVEWRNEAVRSVLAGESDHTFAFMQRAYYIQTGESVALLP